MKTHLHNTQKNQRGATLLFVMMIIAVLLASMIGVGVIVLNRIRAITVVDDSTQAYYTAESGIERTIYELRNLPDRSLTRIPCSDQGELGGVTCTDTLTGGTTWNIIAQKGLDRSNPAGEGDHLGAIGRDQTVELFYEQDPLYTSHPAGFVTVAVWTPVSAIADPQAPALEVTTISYPQANPVASIDADRALDEYQRLGDIPTGNIDISKKTYTLAELQNQASPVKIELLDLGTDFRVRLKAMQSGASFTLRPQFPDDRYALTQDFRIKSFGASGKANAGIFASIYRPKSVPMNSVFDYVLFSEQALIGH